MNNNDYPKDQSNKAISDNIRKISRITRTTGLSQIRDKILNEEKVKNQPPEEITPAQETGKRNNFTADEWQVPKGKIITNKKKW